MEKNLNVCPKCEHHMRLRARLRLERLLDTENRKELGQDVRPVDALKFKDSRKYTDRLSQAASASGETDALVVMEGTLEGLPVVALGRPMRAAISRTSGLVMPASGKTARES